MSQGTLSGRHAAIKLDFGGVAKGFSLDTIVKELKRQEVPAALIDAGGDIRAYGRNKMHPWKVAVRDPRNAQGVLGFIEISGDESIVSSGTYERFYQIGSQRIHHILDPRTGKPAEGTLGVTVIAHQGALADAAATALLIAGKNGWRKVASAMKLNDVLLVTDRKEVIISASMAKRLRPTPGRTK